MDVQCLTDRCLRILDGLESQNPSEALLVQLRGLRSLVTFLRAQDYTDSDVDYAEYCEMIQSTLDSLGSKLRAAA